mmetsp:Transcript_27134/g.43563  ORF Transcript_27134/g.43563 Transcript_27134/m.43563 type:complete len:83 (+) Transcript_27134:167-415(+)
MELNQQVRRQEVPPEYLKEVVVQYILSSPNLGVGPQEHEALIPVMADLLAFSNADHQRLAAAQDKGRGGLLTSAANFFFSPS